MLRQQPLNVREFKGLMERYFRDSWPGGVKTRHIPRPNDSASEPEILPRSQNCANKNVTEARDILYGDRKLRSILWTQRERDEMTLESGEMLQSKKGSMKLERTRREIEAEKEERRVTAEQWKSMNEAVGEVEDEMEVDNTAAAIDGFAISQKQPWQGNIPDRTRD